MGESDGCGGSNLRCIHFLNTCTLYMTDDRYSMVVPGLVYFKKLAKIYIIHGTYVLCVY